MCVTERVHCDPGNCVQIFFTLAIPKVATFSMGESNRLTGICVHQVRHGVWLAAIKPLYKKLKSGCCPELYVQGKFNF
jgi:hypothetical protein